MEQEKDEPESKRLNEGLVEYMRQRSVQEVPRYTVQLKKYISVREKRQRAAFARRNSELGRQVRANAPGKKGSGNSNGAHDTEPADKANVKENRDDDVEERVTRRRSHQVRSRGGSRGPEPRDRCCRKRCCRMGRPVCCPRRRSRCRKKRRRSCRRRRRRSCCPRRRRRRSCRRKRRRRC